MKRQSRAIIATGDWVVDECWDSARTPFNRMTPEGGRAGEGLTVLDGVEAGPPSAPETSVWLRRVAEGLPVALRTAVASPAGLRAWRSCSERHPNGFAKLRLCEWPDGSQLRLHLWERRTAIADVHNHRWSFMSLPLVGDFEEATYELTEGEGSLLQCDSRAKDDSVEVRLLGSAGVQRVVTYRRRPRQTYGCVAGDFHSLVPSGDGVSGTLVYHGAPRDGIALVWRGGDPPTTSAPTTASRVATPTLSTGELGRLFRSLLAAR